MSIESKINSLITAANTKTGKTDADLTSAMQSLVDGYGGGGAPIYRTTEGMAYTPHEVWTAITAPASGFRNNMFRGAAELVDFEWDAPGNFGNQLVFDGCPKLVSVKLPKCTGMWLGNTNCFTGSCTALRTVKLGSIGTPVVRMDAGPFRVPGPVTLTLYVDAATLADIPALVKDKVPGYWPANTTVVYKNSTTGDVIEG